MRTLLQTVINALLPADADAVVGAEWGRPSPDRVAQRNGYRHCDLDTRGGRIDAAVRQLRTGTYLVPLSLVSLGIGPTMLIGAAITLLGFVISWRIAPETKDRTLAETGALSVVEARKTSTRTS